MAGTVICPAYRHTPPPLAASRLSASDKDVPHRRRKSLPPERPDSIGSFGGPRTSARAGGHSRSRRAGPAPRHWSVPLGALLASLATAALAAVRQSQRALPLSEGPRAAAWPRAGAAIPQPLPAQLIALSVGAESDDFGAAVVGASAARDPPDAAPPCAREEGSPGPGPGPGPTPQVLRLTDARTLQRIALVGTMHYNPVSVRRARAEVAAMSAAHGGALGAVVVESCEGRWASTLELAPPGSFTARYLIPSEMHAAADEAARRGVPVLLGDSTTDEFSPRVRECFRETLADLANPPDGWRRIRDDVQCGVRATLDTADLEANALLEGSRALGAGDFIRDPLSVLGLAVSLVRYPLAFALKVPDQFFFVVGALAVVGGSIDAAEASASPVEGPLVAALGAFDVVAPVVLARLMAVAFLEERNARLARSIRQAASERGGPVVAVLGGLHVNGVARLLMSPETPTADGCESGGAWLADPLPPPGPRPPGQPADQAE